MEDKLITVAIHSFGKAQILKTILETEGIDACIHNVNQIQPVVSAGVRVKIKESDLPRALRIIEDSHWPDPSPVEEDKKILIPVDFSDYSIKACQAGIRYAHSTGSKEVMLLHAYCSPFLPSIVTMGDSLSFPMNEEETLRQMVKRVQADMENLSALLTRKMESGELPAVPFNYVWREGLPEDVISDFCKEYRPALIVMGTRGKNQRETDLIGSVTAEMIEVSRTPVLAVPENVLFNHPVMARNVAFATSFHERDLLAFDRFMDLVRPLDLPIHLCNISTSKDHWNEVRLNSINQYFKQQYPNASITHTVLDDGNLLPALQKFLQEKEIDLLALGASRRNLFARIFNPGIARKMLFHSDTPLLVIHA